MEVNPVAFKWDRERIINDDGQLVDAIAPIVISASRSTDIPACYADWFMRRLRIGHLQWVNPFNRKVTHVSLDKVRAIVFWTKNAAPMIPYIGELEDMGMAFYFQYGLNNYHDLGYEPNIPGLEESVSTFSWLSERIGKERVIWRFDPLILSEDIELESLMARLKSVGDRVHRLTEQLVFSFIDISMYKKLRAGLAKRGFREFSTAEMRSAARIISEMNESWGLRLRSCAESIDLTAFGIEKGKCVDGELLRRIGPSDAILQDFLDSCGAKDLGQRKECRCIVSKDIGQYNTCRNGCVYCYASGLPSISGKADGECGSMGAMIQQEMERSNRKEMRSRLEIR